MLLVALELMNVPTPTWNVKPSRLPDTTFRACAVVPPIRLFRPHETDAVLPIRPCLGAGRVGADVVALDDAVAAAVDVDAAAAEPLAARGARPVADHESADDDVGRVDDEAVALVGRLVPSSSITGRSTKPGCVRPSIVTGCVITGYSAPSAGSARCRSPAGSRGRSSGSRTR